VDAPVPPDPAELLKGEVPPSPPLERATTGSLLHATASTLKANSRLSPTPVDRRLEGLFVDWRVSARRMLPDRCSRLRFVATNILFVALAPALMSLNQ
jgi:hypothetical protein